MATNYDINYDDKRFTEVEGDKNAAIKESNEMYDGMISNSDAFYDKQIAASKEYAETQKKNQQAATDFAIEEINQQKTQAKNDYTKEQAGSWADYQKQIDPYGAQAEQVAASGLSNSGYAESLQTQAYVAYQNRVATAREAYQRAVLNYDNAITEARLQNNSLLAEIAYQALQQQLELSLAGFQYKNTLLLSKAETKRTIDNTYYSRYQDVLKQLNTENALAFQQEQFEYQKAQAAKQATISRGGGGGGSSSGGSAKTDKRATGSISKDVSNINKANLISSAKSAGLNSADKVNSFLSKHGLNNQGVRVLTRSEWTQGKKNEGSENSSEFQYSNYNAYLLGYVTWCIQNS